MLENIKMQNNEPCPCGSGKKYNSCCKSKIHKKPTTISDDILNNPVRMSHILYMKLEKTDFKQCLYPRKEECGTQIKNAHTLQNNGILSLLSEDDHVLIVNMLNYAKDKTIFKRESKNKATTFYGFCDIHDTEVFKPIETSKYSKSDEQHFLFAYRAFAQEYHKKKRLMKSLQDCIKEKPSMLKDDSFLYNYRMRQLDIFDIGSYKQIFDNSILNEDYDILENYIVEYDRRLGFAVTTMISLASDLEGNQINDIYSMEKDRQVSMFLTIIPQDKKSYIIFSYLKEDSLRLNNLVLQIKKLSNSDFENYINNLIPEYTENIVLNPKLWNKFTPFSKRKFEEALTCEFAPMIQHLDGKLESEFTIDEMMQMFSSKDKTNNLLRNPHYNLFKEF